MNYKLTKSKYIKGLQCDKALYLDAYKKHLGEINEETQKKFDQGREFESSFKSTFENGIALDLRFDKQMDKYISFTKDVLSQNNDVVLFEAGFLFDEILVLTDVLHKKEDGSVTIYEIKNSTELTDVIKADLAIQFHVCQAQINNLNSFNVVLNDGNDGFKIIEMIDELKSIQSEVKKNITHCKEILQYDDEPKIEVGEQCLEPYLCGFKNYCEGKRKKVIRSHSIDGIELDQDNQEFNNALEFVQQTNTPIIYITGKAGTGKTTFLKYLRATTEKNLVVLAPTGVAAVNAGGQTIHSFFQIDPKSLYVPNDVRLRSKYDPNDSDRSTIHDYFKFNNEKKEIIKKMELLIIDEISMVRCDLLDVIDRLLRVFRNRENVAFGGVQVILIGDTFQLPPITKREEWNLLSAYYSSSFFFNSMVIENNQPIYIELKKIYRQKEDDFINLLNRVRVNEMTIDDYKSLNEKYYPTFAPSSKDNYIILATTNNAVNSYNTNKLNELKGDSVIFEGVVKGTFSESSMPTDKILQLKVGAQIMFRKNNLPLYYNGTIGKIISLNKSKIKVEIEKDGAKKTINVETTTWNNVRYSWNESRKRIEEEIIGTFTQFPIKLAWAITVHKSQGLTFEKVIADVGAAFDYGQVYVALSRCTSFNGLVLKSKITPDAIKTDQRVLDFAQRETPETLIIDKLNTGKADFYYKQSRDAFKNAQYSECMENFIKAIKYRNDIETDLFKRYFEVTAKRLKSFEEKLSSQLNENRLLSKEIESTQSKLAGEEEENKLLENKVEEQSNKIESLTEQVRSIEENIRIKDKQIKSLTTKVTNREKKISSLQEQLENISKTLEEYKQHNLELSEQLKINEKCEEDLRNEITRINNIKWYQKLFGKK